MHQVAPILSRGDSPRRRPKATAIRVTVAAVSISLAAAVALAGCSSTPSSGADAKTVLKVYAWKGGPAAEANVPEINKAFEKAHPNIKLDYEFLPGDASYVQRIQPELLAGNSADVIMTDPGKVQNWGDAGYLESLSTQPWAKDVRSLIKPFISSKGKVYAMPMEIIGVDMYANLTLLEKAGVDKVPTTWPEFQAALASVKAAGITPIALPNKAGWTGSSVLTAIAATKVYQDNPSWDADYVKGTASFSAWDSSIAAMQKLEADGYIDYKSELGVDEWVTGLDDFNSGKSAFWFQGAWNQSLVAKAGVKDVFIPFPAGAAGTKPTANLFVGTMWSINKASKVKSAAEEYVAFWSKSENLIKYLTAESAVNPFTGGKTPTSPATESFVATVDSGNFHLEPSNTWFNSAGETNLQQQVQALWLGQYSTSNFAEHLDSVIDRK